VDPHALLEPAAANRSPSARDADRPHDLPGHKSANATEQEHQQDAA